METLVLIALLLVAATRDQGSGHRETAHRVKPRIIKNPPAPPAR